jgi:hypothetical protein
MKALGWQVKFGVALLGMSLLLYALHYIIFNDFEHISIYFLSDLAFLPIQVFLVTFIIDRVLGEREKSERLEKINMVIGLFFSEMGTKLMRTFSECDPELDSIRGDLIVRDTWSDAEFEAVAARLKAYKYGIGLCAMDLRTMKKYLLSKREFLMRLSENPNLLEHETFTDLLKAVFHLQEELDSREDFSALPEKDVEHIHGDMKRVYALIVLEWLNYMRHLKNSYPYLFSLAMRINPFNPKASAIITG